MHRTAAWMLHRGIEIRRPSYTERCSRSTKERRRLMMRAPRRSALFRAAVRENRRASLVMGSFNLA
jgi:hypothetical protein